MKVFKNMIPVMAAVTLLSGCGSKEKDQLIIQNASLKAQIQTLEKQVSLLEAQNADLRDERKYQMKLDLEKARVQEELIAEQKAQLLVKEELKLKERLLREEQDEQQMARARAWVEMQEVRRKNSEAERMTSIKLLKETAGACARIEMTSGRVYTLAQLGKWYSRGFSGGGYAPRIDFELDGTSVTLEFKKMKVLHLTILGEGKPLASTIQLRNGETLQGYKTWDGQLQGQDLVVGELLKLDMKQIRRITFFDDSDYVNLSMREGKLKLSRTENAKPSGIGSGIVDQLLDYSIRQSGLDPTTEAAMKAKTIGKTAFNPFAPADQLQKDIDDFVQTILKNDE
jgi:outer membrane murein-binding lipoprotein Lpp